MYRDKKRLEAGEAGDGHSDGEEEQEEEGEEEPTANPLSPFLFLSLDFICLYFIVFFFSLQTRPGHCHVPSTCRHAVP